MESGSGTKQRIREGLMHPEPTLPGVLDSEDAAQKVCRRVRSHRRLRKGAGREPPGSRRDSGRRAS